MLKNPIIILLLAFFCVGGFYFIEFHSFSFSAAHEDWGTFGSYFGGVLSPIIAGLAVYLIAKTYNLQKTELKELKDAQAEQLKLAAFTSLLNSNLTQISVFQAEVSQVLKLIVDLSGDKEIVGRVLSLAVSFSCGDPDAEKFDECVGELERRNSEYTELMSEMDYSSAINIHRIWTIETEIEKLLKQNKDFKSIIEKFTKQ